MHKEKINWWWFLLLNGVLIPSLFYVLANRFGALGVFTHLLIAGFNPFIVQVFNFIVFLFICVLFKAIQKIRTKGNAYLITYIILGISVFLLLLPMFFESSSNIGNVSASRRYIDFSPESMSSNYLPMIILDITIILVFIIFYSINFPPHFSEPK